MVRAVALAALTTALAYGALRTFWPYVTALVLAAWLSHLLRPTFTCLAAALRGRKRAAAFLTGALVLLVAAPLALAVTSLIPATRSLYEQVRTASGGRGALAALVSDGRQAAGGVGGIMQLARDYGQSASRAAALVAGASIEAVAFAFVFFVILFALLVDGPRAWRWIQGNAPIEPIALARLCEAFHQAGRGLLVGNGLTALAQGALATVTYALLGIPRAPLLGLLSVAAALLPVTGPTIVWGPVALGLLMTGHPVKAIVLTGVGVFVVGTADNVLRPWLSKRAHVGMPTPLVLLAIFGGIAFFGGWGLLLGPLVVRLAMEALELVACRTQLTPRERERSAQP
jgi:predicted PurR-regulated permease PerM